MPETNDSAENGDPMSAELSEQIKKHTEKVSTFSESLKLVSKKVKHIENIWDIKKLHDGLEEVNSVLDNGKLYILVKDLSKQLEKIKDKEETANNEEDENAESKLQQSFRRKVFEAVRNSPPKTHEEYEEQLKLKKEWIESQAKSLSEKLLKGLLPKLVNEATPGFAFVMEEIRPCPLEDTLCDKFQVYTGFDAKGELSMNHGLSVEKADLPVTQIRLEVVKTIYDRLMGYIKKSELPLYNPRKREGFWKGFLVRTNYAGNALIMIEASLPEDNEASREKLNKVMSGLKEHFECSDAKDCNLVSLLIRVVQNKKSEVKVVLGEEVIDEVVDDLKLKIYGKYFFWSNPHGVRELSKAILELAQVDKEWGVLQMGCGCGITPIYLARECKQVFLSDMIDLMGQRAVQNANDNGVENLTMIPGQITKELDKIFNENLKDFDKVCVVAYTLFNFKDNQDTILLRNNEKVKRILFVSRFTELGHARKLVALCQKNSEWKEPFVITRVVAVDMSPYEEDVKMVFLLERESALSDNIKPNTAYSEAKVTEFMQAPRKRLSGSLRSRIRKRGNRPGTNRGSEFSGQAAKRDVKKQPRPLLDVPVRFRHSASAAPRYTKTYSSAVFTQPQFAFAQPPVQNPVETALAVALAVKQLGDILPGLSGNIQDVVRPGDRGASRDNYRDGPGPMDSRGARDFRGRPAVRDSYDDRSPDRKFARQGYDDRVPSRQFGGQRDAPLDADYDMWGAGNASYRSNQDYDRSGMAQDGFSNRKRGFDGRASNQQIPDLRNTAPFHRGGSDYARDDNVGQRGARAAAQDGRMRGQQTNRALLSDTSMGGRGYGGDAGGSYDNGYERGNDNWGGGGDYSQRAAAPAASRDQMQGYRAGGGGGGTGGGASSWGGYY